MGNNVCYYFDACVEGSLIKSGTDVALAQISRSPVRKSICLSEMTQDSDQDLSYSQIFVSNLPLPNPSCQESNSQEFLYDNPEKKFKSFKTQPFNFLPSSGRKRNRIILAKSTQQQIISDKNRKKLLLDLDQIINFQKN